MGENAAEKTGNTGLRYRQDRVLPETDLKADRLIGRLKGLKMTAMGQ